MIYPASFSLGRSSAWEIPFIKTDDDNSNGVTAEHIARLVCAEITVRKLFKATKLKPDKSDFAGLI